MCQWPNETQHCAWAGCTNRALFMTHHHPGECADFAYCDLHVQAGYDNLFLFVYFSDFNSGTDKVHGASRGSCCSVSYTERTRHLGYTCKQIFIFEFPCIISLYYISNQLDATLAVLFISNCKNTLHVSDVHRFHHQEYINCEVNYRPWTSLLDIHKPNPWHAPMDATTLSFIYTNVCTCF